MMLWCTPFSATVSTMPAASPTITAPGIDSFGIDQKPPPGSALAPQATRSPPSRMPLTSGCILNCCSRSWAEVVASAYSRSMTKPMLTRSSPVFSSFIGYSHVPPICPYLADELQRPRTDRVDHAVQRLGDLPDLLDAELPHLRFAAVAEVELLDRSAGDVPPAALGQHGRLRLDVGARLEVAERLAVLAAALIARAHADDAVVLVRSAAWPRSRSGRTRRPPRPGAAGSAPSQRLR